MEQPYQFAFHDRVSSTPPTGGSMVDFFNRLGKGEKLTRAEKNTVFHSLQSNSRDTNYKISGWVFPFKQFLKRYLVQYDYEKVWHEVWAFDKTCIRESFYTKSNIAEIVLFPEQ